MIAHHVYSVSHHACRSAGSSDRQRLLFSKRLRASFASIRTQALTLSFALPISVTSPHPYSLYFARPLSISHIPSLYLACPSTISHSLSLALSSPILPVLSPSIPPYIPLIEPYKNSTSHFHDIFHQFTIHQQCLRRGLEIWRGS